MKKIFRAHIIATVLLTMLPIGAFADGLTEFRSYTTADGLASNTAYCGVRDQYGFMWIGTQGGLTRYDGRSGLICRDNSANVRYGGDAVLSVEVYGNDIYCGGNVGVRIYHVGTNTFERLMATTRYGVTVNSPVKRILRTSNNLIWICTLGQGVFVYNPKTGHLEQDSRHGSFVCDICQTADGRVCLAMLDGTVGVFSQSGNYLKSYTLPCDHTSKANLCLEAWGNNLWVGCDKNVFFINRSTHQVSNYCTQQNNMSISSIGTMGGSQLLLGTQKGLYTFDTKTHEYRQLTDIVAGKRYTRESINGMYKDRDGVCWIFTNSYGVGYISRNGNQIRTWKLPTTDSSMGDEVYAFSDLGRGSMLIGATSGLYLYNMASQTVVPYKRDAINGIVLSIMQDGNKLYVGTATGGLKVFDSQSANVRTYVHSDEVPYSLSSNKVNCIQKSDAGRIYVGTDWGLNYVDPLVGKFYSFSHIPAMTEFVDLCKDKEGNIWAASKTSGLFRIDAQTNDVRLFSKINNNELSLPSNYLIDVECDAFGRVWAVTDAGICWYDATIDGFHRINTLNDRMRFIAAYGTKGIFLGGEKYTYLMEPKGNGNTMRGIYVDGNLSISCAMYSRSCGKLFVGGDGGFSVLQVPKASTQPKQPVLITSIAISQSSAAQLSDPDKYRTGLYINNVVELPYNENNFSIYFSSPEYKDRTKPLYDFKLEGAYKDWIYGLDCDNASYSNLPPGKYVFMVRKYGGNGAISKLYINILPPWYLTIKAFIAYFIVLALLGFYAYRVIVRMMRRKKNAQKRREKIRQERKLFEMKMRFFVNIVHEIRTPLNLILLPLEYLSQSNKDAETKKYIGVVRQNVDYLLNVANQLLDFKKVDENNIELHKENLALSDILSQISSKFTVNCSLRGVELSTSLPDDDIVTAVDRDSINKILINLMSNALKYTKTKIVVGLTATPDGNVRISVTDDGHGIPDTEKERIFEPFYQITDNNAEKKGGTGIGLAYARQLAAANNGKLYVEDAPGGGSCFCLELPVEKVSASSVRSVEGLSGVYETPTADTSSDIKTSFTLLLVEDNVQLLDFTCKAMRTWYRVVQAKNGAEALEVIEHQNVDMVVSDVMMPVMDGITLCNKIKSNVELSHIPVILLTAKTVMESKVEGLKAGADVYLEKPFTIEQLHLQVENIFRLRRDFHNKLRKAEGDLDTALVTDYGINQQDMTFLQKVQDIVDANIMDESFSIDVLAEQMYMSRSSFYRKLKSLTGMTPVDFLKSQRMKRAAKMLLEGKAVTTVALSVGFTSSSYFTKCFKQTYNVLPRDFVTMKKKEAEERNQ